MIKPKQLRRGDRVALVSLSSGLGGEAFIRSRYELGKRRIESDFGLQAVEMPHALRGIDYLDRHPEARAADLMDAFADPQIQAVFCIIGGDDTVRLLPHLCLETIRKHPKVFMGFSDTTVNHFLMRKAGLVSFYGPAVLTEFAENAAMHPYTKRWIQDVLFEGAAPLHIAPSPQWTSEFLDWAVPENNEIARALQDDEKGFECLQGSGRASGILLGGCLDVFPMLAGTALWPEPDEWEGAILFLETSEECMSPGTFRIQLRGLAAQGILDRVGGILLAKPMGERYYREYNEALIKIVGEEVRRPQVPVLCNVNFGHNAPMCILPYGVRAQIDCEQRGITLLEPAVQLAAGEKREENG